MITVITGTPGAGKTLYAITKLLLPLIGTHVPVTDEDGVTTLHPRIIYTNIRGLLIEHELIDAGDNQGLRDWHTWAKPGAVIVFDEFQKAWPPRANGSKVPDDIQALDTHRHMGVDFILITQNVINTDRHVHGLVGRHLHVRRMANMHLCIVYEWDHCSRQLLYAKSLTKEPWRYSKKVFKLYRSADAHTKQPRKVPGLVWFILAGIGGMAYFGPTAYGRLQDRIAGNESKPAAVAKATPSTVKTTATASPDEKVSSGEGGATTEPKKPVLAGCVRSKARCSCYDETGKVFAPEPGTCERETAAPAIVLAGGTFPENDVYREAPQPVFVGSRTMERGRHLSELVAAGASRRLN
ncbi:zonular occludens toxin domain-containing protein [Comamonas thiooxydans]|uniref:zonular occludens toxin domain-containing protein n=1 Tax=Comamonas thiooxydans TaxID=363952 RepID=UPI00209C4793|nr:zonular occludens toxin domain-containing protein [Comamonas thiooxydans]MCO8251806.1 zonular occludens toxin domain-containing protein [Comamonas thiooxydans]